MKLLKEWSPFALFIIVMLLLRVYVWQPVIVEGHSMDPTLADKERLVIIKTARIKRQDIVKRVIGMPGDTISYNNDVLTVNGKVIAEPYLTNYQKQLATDKLQQTYQFNSFFQSLGKNAKSFTMSATGQTDFTVKVPEGQYFLMGDNRLVSQDSRQVGTFSKKDIIGEAKLRIWPFKKIGLL